MKAFNGYSTNPDPIVAGFEAAKMAGNAKSAKLVFAYMSCDYDVKKVLAGLSQYYKCPIIGNTSFTGVVVPKGTVAHGIIKDSGSAKRLG